jgi:ATP-binding cassette, subfamily B, bacterial MsbA
MARWFRRALGAAEVPIHGVSVFIRLIRYAAPYRLRFAAAIAAMLVYGAASAGLARLIKDILDKVLPRGEQVANVSALIVSLYLLKGLGNYFSAYLMADIGQRVVRDLRNSLHRHILGQSAGFFARRTTGQLLSRVTNDVGQVQHAVSDTVGDLLQESIALFGYAALLFYTDAGLALVCVTGAPLIVYPLAQLGRRLRKTTRRSQEALEHLSHVSAEAYTGHRIVKAFGAEDREAQRFDAASEGLYRTNLKVTRIVSILPPLMELLGGGAIAVALWYGSQAIRSGRLSTGDFVSFIAALLLMYGPVKKLSRVNASLQQAMAAAERIFEVLDRHTEVVEKPAAAPLAPFRHTIDFRDVVFTYDEGHRPILRNVSFTVRAGEMIAIVGRSGAGKTTLVNLLPRFYDVTQGAIAIDGIDIRDVTLASLRAQIGMVTQDTILFDDTIERNIAYGAPHASRNQIEAAARAANAHEFITALPEDYLSFIGERGQRLSGGQRQRLAIARAILKDSPILILDEATSALDSESELLVQNALANLMRNRTCFVIAHRLSTIRRADAIMVIERGRVVEVGRHEDLVMRPNGVYARLHEMQLLESRRSPNPAPALVETIRERAQE